MGEAIANLRRFFTYYLTLGAVISAFILLGVVIYWLIYPYKAVTISEFWVEPQYAVPGGTITYHITYNKYVDLPEYSTLTFACETSRAASVLSNQRSWVAAGEHTIESDLAVPNRRDPEKCNLEFESYYKPNPLREIFVHQDDGTPYISNGFWVGTPSAAVQQLQ